MSNKELYNDIRQGHILIKSALEKYHSGFNIKHA